MFGDHVIPVVPLKTIATDVSRALEDEITAAKTDAGRTIELTDGRLLASGDNDHIYVFQAEIAVALPDDTPITLVTAEGRESRGTLLSIADFEVVLRLDEEVGDTVDRARMANEPWFILQRLSMQLAGLFDDEDAHPLAAALLPGDSIRATDDEAIEEVTEGSGSGPNPSQHRAIQSSTGSPIQFILGPPGTGKTSTLARTVHALERKGERINVFATSNAAVDVATLRIAQTLDDAGGFEPGTIIRMGSPTLPEMRARTDLHPDGILEVLHKALIQQRRALLSRQAALINELKVAEGAEAQALARELTEIRNELGEIKKTLRESLAKLVKEARIVCTTLARMAIDDLVWSRECDAVVIDEASMASFPFVLASATRPTKRLLIFGDDRQLPPIFLARTAKANKWLGRDAFNISGVSRRLDQGLDDPRRSFLDTQYRMREPIADVVSDFAYRGMLKTSSSVGERPAVPLGDPLFTGRHLVLVDTSKLGTVAAREARTNSYSRVNPWQAALSLHIAERLVASGCDSIGLVSPYRAQARLLQAGARRLGSNLTAATVHRFQGGERDAIIVDLTDAHPMEGPSNLTGRDVETTLRLMNVAISRARELLVVVADLSFMNETHSTGSPVRKLLGLVRSRGHVIQCERSGLLPTSPHRMSVCNWDGDWGATLERFLDVAQTNRDPIWINAADSAFLDSRTLDHLRDRATSGAHVVLAAPTEVVERLEDSEIDLKLSIARGGTFALAGNDAVLLAGSDEQASAAHLRAPRLAKTFHDTLIGPGEPWPS